MNVLKKGKHLNYIQHKGGGDGYRPGYTLSTTQLKIFIHTPDTENVKFQIQCRTSPIYKTGMSKFDDKTNYTSSSLPPTQDPDYAESAADLGKHALDSKTTNTCQCKTPACQCIVWILLLLSESEISHSCCFCIPCQQRGVLHFSLLQTSTSTRRNTENGFLHGVQH